MSSMDRKAEQRRDDSRGHNGISPTAMLIRYPDLVATRFKSESRDEPP
jgi:hypothetical protein